VFDRPARPRSALGLLSALVLAGCGSPAASGPAPTGTAAPSSGTDAGLVRSAEAITPEEILADITFLASDEMMGRDTPSPGLERAAEYIAEEFAAMGLEPAGDAGSYIQRFPYRRVALQRDRLQAGYRSEGGGTSWAFGSDFWVVPGQQAAQDVGAVWGGPAGSPFADVTANAGGRIAFFSTEGNPVAGEGTELLTAFQAAFSGGARAIALVLDDTQTADTIREWAAGIQGSGLATPVPILGVTSEAAEAMALAAGTDLAPLMSAGRATPLDAISVTAAAPVSVSEHEPPNVVAILPGSDPALDDEYVVYSAHFDHVGVGLPDETGDSIYNGADDDASGTAVMLAAARAFSRLETAPARSILFLAVSGEEKGLLGSEYFAANAPIPMEGVLMNINMDMVGRNHPDTVTAIGREYTNLGEMSDRIVERHPDIGLTVIQDQVPEEQYFFRSDHLQFVKQDIPAIFFSTGDHDQYHNPGDEAHLIDEEKASRIARLVFLLGAEVASGAADPAWLPGALDEVRRIIAENEGG